MVMIPYLISLDISSMTERSCWYLVWLAGSRAPLVGGSWDREGAGPEQPIRDEFVLCWPIRDQYLPVGVDDWGGLDSERSLLRGVLGVLLLELLNWSCFLPPPTLVKLVPAAATTNQRSVLISVNQSDVRIYLPTVVAELESVQTLNYCDLYWSPSCLSSLSTNQRWVLYCINQSEVSILLYQPIRGQLIIVSTNQRSAYYWINQSEVSILLYRPIRGQYSPVTLTDDLWPVV